MKFYAALLAVLMVGIAVAVGCHDYVAEWRQVAKHERLSWEIFCCYIGLASTVELGDTHGNDEQGRDKGPYWTVAGASAQEVAQKLLKEIRRPSEGRYGGQYLHPEWQPGYQPPGAKPYKHHHAEWLRGTIDGKP